MTTDTRGHAHKGSGRTLSRPLNPRTMEDRAALDAVANVLATTDLDASALDKITDLVRHTGRAVIDRNATTYRESECDGAPTIPTDTDGTATVPDFLRGVMA